MENWLGQIQIKVDEKGRLSLPALALEVFDSNELVLSVGVFEKKPYLELLRTADWQDKLETLKSLPAKSPKTRAYTRFLMSGSSKVTIDKSSRITIPAFQRDMIKLIKDSVLVNLENKVELWSSENWSEVSNNFINDFENLEEWISDVESDVDANDRGGSGLKSVA